jgi:hypothetical protein
MKNQQNNTDTVEIGCNEEGKMGQYLYDQYGDDKHRKPLKKVTPECAQWTDTGG